MINAFYQYNDCRYKSVAWYLDPQKNFVTWNAPTKFDPIKHMVHTLSSMHQNCAHFKSHKEFKLLSLFVNRKEVPYTRKKQQ